MWKYHEVVSTEAVQKNVRKSVAELRKKAGSDSSDESSDDKKKKAGTPGAQGAE